MAGKAFLLYYDVFEALLVLPSDQKWTALEAMVLYSQGKDVNIESLPDGARIVFTIAKGQIDRDADKYRARCEANKQNGKKGGRPPKKYNPFDDE